MIESGVIPINKKERKAVLKRDNHRCVFCGNNHIHVHHIVYRSHGGADIKENMVCLCKTHHDMVHQDERKYKALLLDRMRGHYGCITEQDLKKKGKWSELKYGN